MNDYLVGQKVFLNFVVVLAWFWVFLLPYIRLRSNYPQWYNNGLDAGKYAFDFLL